MSVGTTSTFTCPSCGKVGSSSRPIPPGTRLRCKCGFAFRTEDQGDAYEVAPGPAIGVPGAQPSRKPRPVAHPMDDAPAGSAIFPSIIVDEPDEPSRFEVRPTARIGRGPEPRYFRWMEMFGWTSVVIGTLEFAVMVGASLFLCIMALYHAPDQQEAIKVLRMTVMFCTPFIAWAGGVLVMFLLSGFGLWIAVDMARSLRFQCGER